MQLHQHWILADNYITFSPAVFSSGTSIGVFQQNRCDTLQYNIHYIFIYIYRYILKTYVSSGLN